MYWFIPRCHVFKTCAVAGVVVGIIFEILKLTFGVIVDNFTSYKAVYGAFGDFAVVLTLDLYFGILFCLGCKSATV